MARANTKTPGYLRVSSKLLAEGFKVLLFNSGRNHERKLDEIRPVCQDDFRPCMGSFFRHNWIMKKEISATDFERKFVEKITKIIDTSPGLNHSKFAKAIWGDNDASVAKWRRIRNKSKAGKPQNLTIAEAFLMMDFLSTNLASFSWDVSKEIEFERKNNSNPSLPQPTTMPFGKTGN